MTGTMIVHGSILHGTCSSDAIQLEEHHEGWNWADLEELAVTSFLRPYAANPCHPCLIYLHCGAEWVP